MLPSFFCNYCTFRIKQILTFFSQNISDECFFETIRSCLYFFIQ
ncbi:hypothetical protein M153_3190006381 [Pseudoloma neurophilia]|uniref:Uncharacterized protein n=1 Tax=Pseudoloma neurophilia TaxID=146866 RepID=A0A0R0LYI7_9MICR|nr:hypothetical protein M153_3190006381 [Pseudoloma neurophilia]